VASACDILGFDPLYIANEGKVIIILPEEEAKKALSTMKEHPYGQNAAQIGKVSAAPAGRVFLQTIYGSRRILDVLSGEMLPRIC
jgi:hydrogenase expression/formation protein HypE